MSHGHLVEETDFFSHCYPKDKGEHKEKEGLSSQSKRQKASVFLCHSLISHPLPLSSPPQLPSLSFFFFFFVSKNPAALKRQRERGREREKSQREMYQLALERSRIICLTEQKKNYLPYGKQSHLNPFPEANSESIHVAISLYQFLRLQLIFSLAALL